MFHVVVLLVGTFLTSMSLGYLLFYKLTKIWVLERAIEDLASELFCDLFKTDQHNIHLEMRQTVTHVASIVIAGNTWLRLFHRKPEMGVK
jgi:hypothetical protein